MPKPILHNCPACKSPVEIDRFMGFTSISCTNIKCSLSTNVKVSFEEVIEEWDERCRIYPKDLPDDWVPEKIS